MFILKRKQAKIQPAAPRIIRYTTEPNVQYQIVYERIYNSSQHLLIGGTTGSGKSVLLNGILSTAVLLNSPATTELILIDPKRVELRAYASLPHVLRYGDTTPTIISALTLACNIIDKRISDMITRCVKTYDGAKVVIVIDELGDLLTNPAHTAEQRRQIIGLLQHVMQIGRAAKVFVFAATQSPSRQTIPAAIRLNFTDFIALRCATRIESRQVIGENGAELLPRYGYGLYRTPDQCGLQKIAIPYIDDDYIRARTAWWGSPQSAYCVEGA